MLKNYFKIALRNILKHKFFSLINILGMTIGVTACLLIILYVSDELSYDKFHAKADRMYQVGLHGKIAGQEIYTSTTCPPLSAALVSEIPEIDESTRLDGYGLTAVKYNEKAFTEEKLFYADSNFFEFFSFELLEGERKTALKEPNSIVFTTDLAKKYFGNEPALGKLVTVGSDGATYKVTGIAANAPTNSHVIFSALVSASSAEHLKSTVWLNNGMYTYFTLNKNASLESATEKFSELVVKYVGPEIERFMGTSLKQMKEQGGAYGYFAEKVTDIHLRSKAQHTIEPPGNITYVYFFAGIGGFIIIIACINFMNLSTARSAGRAKEVGLRKTLGSLRGQMIAQFLAESMIYSLITIVLALGACYILLPFFNTLSGKQLDMTIFMTPAFIAGIIALVLFVGLIAGSYPAFYLTSFNAVEVLKGKVRAGMKSGGVRSTLVVCQFALSIFLIIFTTIVYQQITFMQERNMGIDKHNVVVIRNAGRLGNNRESFKNSLNDLTGIVKSSYTNNNFPGVNNTTVFKSPSSDQDHIMGLYYADYDHMDVLKFELKEGRYFSKDFPSDSSGIILNEAAVKEFGYTNPLEEEVLYNDNGTPERFRIIGVYKDFNFESLKIKVRPLAIMLTKNANQLMVRYDGNSKDAIASIGKLWKTQAPNEPFDYNFLDENFDELFRVEQRMGQVFSVFSGLAIFIACLGLFALAAFTAEQRTKEIGIRKALGASPIGLVILLSKEFTKLVIIAFIPAAVAAWFIVNNWLSGFEYRVDINPWIFIGSGLVAIFIAWLTVSYQSIKAAATNPVNSLRYE
ncbi:ABC transporter permease [Ohtaekwangia koreensis]|uniref:Putative ABC transport system permease protein n=1 Tax=Ohtaekwangia koreensis TaxID=688867 RepID=A0A1T5MF03_9BACT|nr:ABC transporter permease [Ohtaekwangia koreensis]SKC86772.1 putative ABC transport system permease protein [Ohtaekwangia koreensis]